MNKFTFKDYGVVEGGAVHVRKLNRNQKEVVSGRIIRIYPRYIRFKTPAGYMSTAHMADFITGVAKAEL